MAIKLSLILASVLLSLFVIEIGLRIAGYSYPNFYTPDPDRGVALRPGIEGWYRKEGKAYIKINSVGLRDLEHSIAKPPNTFRIAVLGDSYAEALQVPMEQSFWWVMKDRLQECPAFVGQEIEVINFGVSGYGTAQELITLRRDVWQYSPDLILLAFTTNNDVTDNSRALKNTNEIPYFVFQHGELVLDDSFKNLPAFRLRQSAVNKFGRWVADHLLTLQAIDQAHRALKALITSHKAAPAEVRNLEAPPDAQRQPGDEIGIDNLIYREPGSPVWIEAWNVTEGLLVTMAREIESKGAQFLVVTLSNGIQVHPSAAARNDFMKRLGVNDLFYPEKRIKLLCDREGISILNLAAPLREYAEENRVYIHGFGKDMGNGHWNPIGHRLAGELIGRRLCEDRKLVGSD